MFLSRASRSAAYLTLVVAGSTLAGIVGSARPACASEPVVRLGEAMVQEYDAGTGVVQTEIYIDGVGALLTVSGAAPAFLDRMVAAPRPFVPVRGLVSVSTAKGARSLAL